MNIFTKYAESVEWLQWAEGKGVFKPLFSLNNPSGEISSVFAKWFAEKYVCRYPEDALAVVQRQGQIFSPLLWKNIAVNLGFSESIPEPTILAKWVEILLTAPIYPSTQGKSLNFYYKSVVVLNMPL
ncbi:hypothetical protein [Petrotoga sibirica]|uniref:Uncharacterized protein n=1 Tax=Petrotoga sibirica TaxID=156202 RepID=A0A4R8EI59_9BACT|nr:hypothetical protein [Petrotoga sibirica]TDX10075.1 hypothetical protein C8D74_1235 [Petrotoga sibirica]